MNNQEDIKAELERLRAENQALKKTSAKGLSLKVSERAGFPFMDLADSQSPFTRNDGKNFWIWRMTFAPLFRQTSHS